MCVFVWLCGGGWGPGEGGGGGGQQAKLPV